MATRKAITLVSGLFQEVNTPTDKLDFAGNTTADLTENTNLYYTDTRSRAAISVTDTGGDGSLAYNNSTGVITYTGPSSSEARAHFSVASGSGLTYNSGTGEFGTSAIPNGQLANSSVTIGSTSVSLGATVTNFAGLGQLVMQDIHIGSGGIGGASTINIQAGQIIFEGSTADANETILSAADATGGDKSLILPNESGTILSTGSSIANSNLANSSITIGSTSVALGATQGTFAGLTSLASTTLVSGTVDGANSITLASGNITFEGSTADGNEIILTAVDASGSDKTITLPNATGTVALLSTLSVASGSGLTYNSGTGEFSTNAIPNAQLANSSVTVGTTGIALGGSATTIVGLASVTSNAVITNDNGFRIRDNSDNTKQLAFECSGISTSTTRTLTVPNENGTLVTSGAIVNADINASAAIAGTKISPDFGSQIIQTTGSIVGGGIQSTANLSLDSDVPTINFNDSNSENDFELKNNNGTFTLRDKDAASDRLTVTSAGQFTFATNVDFSSGIDVTGDVTATGNLTISSNKPTIVLTEGDANPDYQIFSQGGAFKIKDSTNAADRLVVNTDGHVDIAGNLDVGAGLDVTGDISVTGTVDGVDVATRDTLFGGLTSSSGVLSNGVTATTQSASDNSTKVATTAYVDNQVTSNVEFSDNTFRVKDNSDASKKLAFECSGISGSTTRTMTVPNTDGTISTESFATAIAVALG